MMKKKLPARKNRKGKKRNKDNKISVQKDGIIILVKTII